MLETIWFGAGDAIKIRAFDAALLFDTAKALIGLAQVVVGGLDLAEFMFGTFLVGILRLCLFFFVRLTLPKPVCGSVEGTYLVGPAYRELRFAIKSG